jgi:hypothetical protein
MKTFLRYGIIEFVLLSGMSFAAAQVVPDLNAERPNFDLRGGSVAPAAELQLTPEQKIAIYNAVRQVGAKAVAPPRVRPTVGEQVPPSIALDFLPDGALAHAPEAKGVKYTMVEEQVVLIDPTTMRVVDIIKQ